MTGTPLRHTWQPADQPDTGSTLCVIGLNPSTASDGTDDPTTRRIRAIAADLGHSRIMLVNLYAARATDPTDLRRLPDRGDGPDNDAAITAAVAHADQVLVAWGAAGGAVPGHDDRVRHVLGLLGDTALWAKGTTKQGHPRHPLYNNEPVRRWTP